MSSKSVLDSMMEAIEEYTVLLEERLEERAVEWANSTHVHNSIDNVFWCHQISDF
jgi:hypothetical protein